MSRWRRRAAALLAVVAGLALATPAPADPPAAPAAAAPATALFAGGCFWCMEPPFEKLAGVTAVISGYTGGTVANPSYEAVSAGQTGHYEAVQVTYDPTVVSYDTLLGVYWRNIDPLDGGGQFCDRGDQYRAAIFYQDKTQQLAAEASRQGLEQRQILPGKIVTPILPAQPFYPAEAYHQDFYKKNPVRYQGYRVGCGRDKRLASLWGDAPAVNR